MSNDCIFCKLSSGEVETDFVYEDDVCVAFKDANPKAKTHILIVSKKHITSLLELEDGDSEVVAHMIMKVKEVAEKVNLKGYMHVRE